MSLITAKKLFERSFQQNFSLAAFNVFNVESLQAVVEACEHEKSPAIIQISSGARKYMQDEILFLDYVKAILEKSKCSFVLHHDHIKSVEEAKKAVDMGFSSVMFDGSALPFEENVTRTREIVEYAHKKGVWVEAELGSIPGFEDEVFSEHAKFTDKESVNHFIEATGCDSLAVSVGTAHGGVLSADGNVTMSKCDEALTLMKKCIDAGIWLCTLKVFCNIFPKFSLIAHSCVFYAVKQEWEIRDRHFRCFRPHGCSDYAHFHDSTFRIVICYLFASKYTGIINLDIITSIGRLFHHRFEHICQCLCGWCLI